MTVVTSSSNVPELPRSSETSNNIGSAVRSYREMRGKTIREVAVQSKISPGFLSQLENGRTGASLETIKRISHALGVTLAELVDSETGATRGVTRKLDRAVIPSDHGSTKFVISKPPMRNVEVYDCVFEPGGSTGDSVYAIGNSQEIVICQEGRLRVVVGDEHFELGEGDSLEFRSTVPHGIWNDGTEVARVIWIVSPPTK